MHDKKFKNHTAWLTLLPLQLMLMFLILFFAFSVHCETCEIHAIEVSESQPQESEPVYQQVKKREYSEGYALFDLPLEELMNTKIEVASVFPEQDLVAGSSVYSICSEKWKKLGARRIHDVVKNETSVMTYPLDDFNYIVIRGFTNAFSYKGMGVLIDGTPVNDLSNGSALFHSPNWEIGTLDKVELIKGPGSAIYGSDAFHGVFSMKSFESDKNICIVEGAGGYPLYGDTSMKISQGIAADKFRIDAAIGLSTQDDLNMKYKYNDDGITGTGSIKNEYDSGTLVFKMRTSANEKIDIKAGVYTNYLTSENFAGLQLGTQDKDLVSRENRFYMGNSMVTYMLNNKISLEMKGFYWKSKSDSDFYIHPTMYMATHTRENRSGVNLILKQDDNIFNLQWFIAYSYDNQEIEHFSREIKTEDGLLVNNLGEQPQSGWSRHVKSIFGQLKWGVAKDTFYFLFGGRMDDYSNYDLQLTPRCGLIFLPNKKSSIKALYGRAFMAPNAFNHFGSAGFIEGNPDLAPETIDVYELIYMYRTKQLKFSVHSFYSLWKDGIIAKYIPEAQQTNEGKNQSYGGEMAIFYSMEPFAFESGLSYVKSKAIDSMNPDTLEKEDIPYKAFPEYSVNLGLHYTLHPMGMNFYINNRIYLNMNETISPNAPDPQNEFYQMDFNIKKKFKNTLEITLDVQNVLDQKNRISIINENAERGHELPGRSIVLRTTYAF